MGLKKRKSIGVEEMKCYLELIINKNDKGIAFLCGSYLSTFEELRKSLVNSKLSGVEIQCIRFGRLGAVLDLFFAYFGLQEENNNASNSSKEKRVTRYVS
jgi:hypothetical protein